MIDVKQVAMGESYLQMLAKNVGADGPICHGLDTSEICTLSTLWRLAGGATESRGGHLMHSRGNRYPGFWGKYCNGRDARHAYKFGE